jgi:hypothetical protein
MVRVPFSISRSRRCTYGHDPLERSRVRSTVPFETLETVELPEVEDEEYAQLLSY